MSDAGAPTQEAKHTPGPWRRGQEGNLRIYGPDGQGEHSGLIAEVKPKNGYGTGNALLIANLPVLLESHKQLQEAAYRLENTIRLLRTETRELQAWKESAMAVMPDYQEIARLLELPLGSTVHDKIVPAIAGLLAALERSVQLQSHYAQILNGYDGGQRIGFASGAEWIERLKKVGTIK